VVQLAALDDRFVLVGAEQTLNVLLNDEITNQTRIVSVTQPKLGSVEIVDNELHVSLDESVREAQVLTYTIRTGEREDSATVTLLPLGLAPEPIDTRFIDSDAGTVDTSANSEEDAGLTGLIGGFHRPAALLAFAELELPLLGFSVVGGILGIGLLMLGGRRRKQRFVSVVGVPRNRGLASRDNTFVLRHDAEPLWLTGRSRDADVEVETGNETMWMNRDRFEGLL